MPFVRSACAPTSYGRCSRIAGGTAPGSAAQVDQPGLGRPGHENGSAGTCRCPSKRRIWACLIGAKSVGLVLTRMPGSNIGNSSQCRSAACFITFSRVRSSPHCFSSCTVVWAIE